MEKNDRTSQFVNVADIMDARSRKKEMSQRIFRQVRKHADKRKGDLLTLGDYAKTFGITLAEAMIVFKRITKAELAEELRLAALNKKKEE